ncbi:hypothetical protein JOB18_035519 [Solea senegalensis]|uniref:Uncharacterized protein n=1 Tax=Solea senegalensis TaxID=28829 RepID=A0AAV6SN52_SOLSE|nr:hypothetical protein JOB18_035519 [Solea senegalensis]
MGCVSAGRAAERRRRQLIDLSQAIRTSGERKIGRRASASGGILPDTLACHGARPLNRRVTRVHSQTNGSFLSSGDDGGRSSSSNHTLIYQQICHMWEYDCVREEPQCAHVYITLAGLLS